MAQTGYTPILIYSSSTASNTPLAANLTNSALGSELAINIADGKLFYKDSGGAVQVIGWKVVPTTAGGTGLTSYTAGDTLYYSAGSTLSKLGIGSSGYYMSSSGTAPQWSAPAALTASNDTNVTLTVGGSASTALLNAASVTAGWTGLLSIARGGTNSNATPTAGGVGYGTGTAHAYSSAGTSGQALLSGGAGAPTWGTLGVGAGGTGLTSFTANGVLYASSSSVLATSSSLTFDGTSFYANGNGLFGTTTTAGSASSTTYVVGGNFSTVNGTTSVPSSTPTTAVTLPNVNYGAWLVNIAISTGAAGTWSSSYIVVTQGTSSNIGTLIAGSGSGLGIQMSGLNLQLKQGSGATFNMGWSLTRIF